MRVTYRKKFLKDLAHIPSRQRKRIELFVFEQFPAGDTIFSTGKLEKLHGYRGY